MVNHEVVKQVLTTFKFPDHHVAGLTYDRIVPVQCNTPTGLREVPVTITLLPNSLEWRWQGVQRAPVHAAQFGIASEGQQTILGRMQSDLLAPIPVGLSERWPGFLPTEQGKAALVETLRAGFDAAEPHFRAIEQAQLPVTPIALPLNIAGGAGVMHLRVDTGYTLTLCTDGSMAFLIEATTGHERHNVSVLMVEGILSPDGKKCHFNYPDSKFIRTFVARLAGRTETQVSVAHLLQFRKLPQVQVALEMLRQEVHRLYSAEMQQVFHQMTSHQSA